MKRGLTEHEDERVGAGLDFRFDFHWTVTKTGIQDVPALTLDLTFMVLPSA